MFALLASQLLLVVSHDAAAHGQLRALERYADRMELVVSLGEGNAISDSAREAIARWPALVAIELVPPLSPRDAASLHKLPRLAVRLPPAPGKNEPPFIPLRQARKEVPSLARLGSSLVRVERAPSIQLAPGPCPGSDERVLADGSSEVRMEKELTRCDLDWLRARLEPHAELPGDIPPEMQPAEPARKRAPRKK